MGKSRLLHEFRLDLRGGETVYAEGWCQSFGQAMLYLPLQDLVRASFSISETDAGKRAAEKISEGLTQLGLDPVRHTPYLLQLLGIKEGTEDLAKLSPETIKGRTLETLLQMELSQPASGPRSSRSKTFTGSTRAPRSFSPLWWTASAGCRSCW